jgi:hypothetical protein
MENDVVGRASKGMTETVIVVRRKEARLVVAWPAVPCT